MRRPVVHRLETGAASLSLLDFGCTTQDICLLDGEGRAHHQILGFRDPAAYLDAAGYLGAIVGRVANRIAGARFSLSGHDYRLDANEAPHHLHGGSEGLSQQFWQIERDGSSRLRARHVSPDGAMGYPGKVDFIVIVSLDQTDGLTVVEYDMTGLPDRPTPISLAQHNYWNLAGGAAPVLDHLLTVDARHYLQTTPELIPRGNPRSVSGTSLDFTQARTLGQADPSRRGLDACLCLDGPEVTLSLANGARLTLQTDQPGLQLYTASGLAAQAAPLAGQYHQPFYGVCLEPQGWPDAVNRPDFPTIIATPDRPYRQRLVALLTPPGC